jgi:hypothetical protein
MMITKKSAVIMPVIEYKMIMATAVLGDGPNGFDLSLLFGDPPCPPLPVPFTG